MTRYAAFVLLLAAGIVFQLSHGVEVNITDKEGKLCLYANLMVDFSVLYVAAEKNDTVEIELPSAVTTDGSECGTTSSTLKLNFGDGHSWSVNFTMNGNMYQADSITFSYNLSDSTVFPRSVSNEIASVTGKSQITNVGVDTSYSCKSKDMILADVVNMTLTNVLIQAFVSEGKSKNITSCSADQPVTTPPPTTAAPATTAAPVTNPTTAAPVTNPTTAAPVTNPTTAAPVTKPTTTAPVTKPTTTAPVTNPTTTAPVTNATTAAPVTNATTAAPVTNATTAAPVTNATSTAPPPTPTPTPTLPPPNTGKYSVNSDNTTVCMLANFGLRIGIKQGEMYQEMNLDPNKTVPSGLCGVNSSQLQLVSDTMTIVFTFINDTAKFRLHGVNFTTKTGSGVDINVVNTNLSLWEAAIGSSYMCNKEQNYTITNQLSFYTFNLQVQPFGITKGAFSTAEECQADEDSFLVPIAVGIALLALIVIVLLAYFIGRKRNIATGYESF